MLVLDHIAVSAETLEEGARWVAERLGVVLSDIGYHDVMGTHNRLLSLGPGTYLEVIAVDPAAPRPAHPRWFNLDAFSGPPRLTTWVARTDDLTIAIAAAPPGSGRPMSFARGPYLWQMAVPPEGRLPFNGCAPAMIEWESAVHPADRLADQGCRLKGLTIEHPEADALIAFPLAQVDGVTVTKGPAPHLSARIATPSGTVVLG